MKQKRDTSSLTHVTKARKLEFVQKGVKSKQGKLISSVQCSLNSVIAEEEEESCFYCRMNQQAQNKRGVEAKVSVNLCISETQT